MSLFRKPFVSTAFYPVPALWLEHLRQPLELDARELLLYHHVPPGNDIAFPEERPSAYWVRENDDHLPPLMSHPTFRTYRKALLDDANPEGAFLLPHPEHRECYCFGHWPHFQHKPIFFRPKAYMENRWPIWLGSQWPARTALVGLMALMTQRPTESDDGEISVEAGAGEIRRAAEAALPGVEVSRHVRSGLRDLLRLGLVKEHHSVRRGLTYRFTSAAFAHSPQPSSAAIARQCALDTDRDRHWVELIATFLRYNGLTLEEAPRIWQKILRYDRHLSTEADAQALIAQLHARAGHASTAVNRALKDFAKRSAGDERHWQCSNQVQFSLTTPTLLSAEMALPILEGAQHHLQATQLIIRYQRSQRLSAETAAAAVEGIAIDLYQPPNVIALTASLHANAYTIKTETRLNCNHLHRGQMDYSQPFRLLIRTKRPEAGVTLQCVLRMAVT